MRTDFVFLAFDEPFDVFLMLYKNEYREYYCNRKRKQSEHHFIFAEGVFRNYIVLDNAEFPVKEEERAYRINDCKRD